MFVYQQSEAIPSVVRKTIRMHKCASFYAFIIRTFNYNVSRHIFQLTLRQFRLNDSKFPKLFFIRYKYLFWSRSLFPFFSWITFYQLNLSLNHYETISKKSNEITFDNVNIIIFTNKCPLWEFIIILIAMLIDRIYWCIMKARAIWRYEK